MANTAGAVSPLHPSGQSQNPAPADVPLEVRSELVRPAVLPPAAGADASAGASSSGLRPWLRVADARHPVRLTGLHVQGQIVGDVVRTTLELHFFNPNDRVLEGQLQFPLLSGQEVSGFALDIDGVWRDAVPVEKAKGRQVFEDVTRARVDPALLEAAPGKQFKLRVYPLPAQGQRRVRITLSERLQADATGQARWRLLLPQGEQPQHASVQLMAVGLNSQQIRTVHGLPGAAWQMQHGGQPQGAQLNWQWTASPAGQPDRQKRSTPQAKPAPMPWASAAQGALEFELALTQAPAALTQTRAGRHYFYANLAVPQAPAVARPRPQDVALVWDASGSGAMRDHARELVLLDAYFRAIGNTRVHLSLARDRAEPAGTFVVRNGDWSALRRALQAVAYDGASSAAAWQPSHPADVIVLVSDGLLNYGTPGKTPTQPAPVLVLHAATSSDAPRLQQLAQASGGTYVDLMQTSAEQGARLLLQQPLRLLKAEGAGLSELVASPINAQGQSARVAVAGQRAAGARQLHLHWQLPSGEVQVQTVDLPKASAEEPGPGAASLWARLMVDELSANYAANKPRITALGKEFALLTRATSLIVLDNVMDYVHHGIVPPEPLRAEYERIRAERKFKLQRDEQQHLKDIVRRFEAKQDWWRKDFPKGPRPKPRLPGKGGAALRMAENAEAEMAATDMRVDMRADTAAVSPMERRALPSSPVQAPAMAAAPATMHAKNLAAGGDSSAAASIRLQKWAPDSPYARRLRAAAADRAYAVYLAERSNYRNSTAFYLDAADIFFEKKQPELALRILSNLAEMDLENRHVLRILGYRLLQARRADLALPVLEKVLELAPDEPQSWRDVGLARAQAGQPQQAADALYEVVRRPWHNRFPDVELIALAELNALIARHPRRIDTRGMDARLLHNLPLDVRVVLSWDADNTDIDLWVTDPNGEKTFYGSPLSYQGGRLSRDFTGGYGPEEFSLKNAKPGKYRVQAQFYGHNQQIVVPATTLQLELFTNYGRPTQQSRAITLRLAGQKEVVDVGEFEVDAQGRIKGR
ncbi:MAG: tetratricopeptide repeat protein [Brachymonas sp.]|nr:tetratricopeptide repeat protein [Brachymonas sp.]